jgi:hypothetical protein
MSFDLFLQRFDSGDSAQVDRTKVLHVLRRHCQDSCDQFGFYLVEFPDGSDVEFSARGLESSDEFAGCAFHIRDFSPSLMVFVFDVADAGDMIIFNPQGADEPNSPLAILVNESQLAHMPDDAAANPVICKSASHLGQLLGLGFEQWEDYRDAIVGRNAGEP